MIFNCIYLIKAEQYAFLIGISEYPINSGWNTISGEYDVSIIKNSLRLCGYQDSSIVICTGKEAIKEQIISKLRILIEKLNNGDFVYFHFSGHGQQVIDVSGDETDGLDEAIVPYDSPKYFREGINEGQYLITDDELRIYFDSILAKINSSGQLFVAIDACHSGSAIRGTSQARGTTEVMGKEINLTGSHKIFEIEENIGFSNSDLVAFFACSPQQLNYEFTDPSGNQAGLLSFLICRHLPSIIGKEQYSYFFDLIKSDFQKILPDQTPSATGNLNVLVKSTSDPLRIRNLHIIKQRDESHFVLNAGWIHNVDKGDQYAVFNYGGGVIDTFSGVIEDVMVDHSLLKIGNYLGQYKIDDLAPQLIRKNPFYNKISISVQISDSNCYRILMDLLESIPVFKIVDNNADLSINQDRNRSKFELILRSGQLYGFVNFDSLNLVKFSSQIEKLFKSYAKDEFFRRMDLPDRTLDFNLSYSLQNNNLPVKENFKPLNNSKLKIGDKITLKVRNQSSESYFFNLIGLQPDYKTNIYVPPPYRLPEEFYLEPGKEMRFPFEIKPPVGLNCVMIIATAQPVNLYFSSGSGRAPTVNENDLNNLFQSWCTTDLHASTTRATNKRTKEFFAYSTKKFIFTIIHKD
ncbi:MAG: caspase family protein [Saprospiraceae bacterium]|nr:caspase family protein [Saprospiraceae bacterium]MBK7738173.1 caspase family protein [Saprospiraceae bacterium]